MPTDKDFPGIYDELASGWELMLQSRFPDIEWIVDRYEDVKANDQIEYNAKGRELIGGAYIAGKNALGKQKRVFVSTNTNPDGEGSSRNIDEMNNAIVSAGNKLRTELLAETK